jgi:MarR family transcriptional regulator, organic hydroperoxide resistance regulator
MAKNMSKANRVELERSIVVQMRHFIADSILFNQRLADQLGINSTDYQILNLIDLLGSPTPGDIAALTGFTTGGVTVALDRLENAQYVRRERNPNDRRSVVVRFLPHHKQKVFALYRPIDDFMKQVFTAYNEREIRTILDFFSRCTGPARQRIQGKQTKKRAPRKRSTA